MIEKPDIPDEKIVLALWEHDSLRVDDIEFLPLGLDPASSSYRVDGRDGTYFLKIRKGLPNPAGALIPRYLREQGFDQVMSPLSTKSGEAWAKVDDLYFILYPYVAGQQVWDVGMSDAHWVEFGTVMKRLHTTRLPSQLLSQVQRESFVPPRLAWDQALHARIKTGNYDDPFQKELARFWLEHDGTIATVLARAENLSEQIRGTNPEFCLCHSDVHTANLLITPDDRIFIVDWDDTELAPKERDLMFLPGDLGSREQELFFSGYGETEIDPLAQAYYRYHWCVEDMGGFAQMVFTGETIGEKTKIDSISWFKSLFAPGSSVETALSTPMAG